MAQSAYVLNARAAGVEHVVGVHAHAVLAAVDARVVHAEFKLLQMRATAREAAHGKRRVDKNLRGAGDAGLDAVAHQHQGRAAIAVPGDGLRVPGDVFGLFAQEVILTALRPQLVEFVGGKAAILQQFGRRVAGLPNPLLLARRVFQTAAQRAFGLRIELAQQAAAPGVPEFGVGAVDIGDGEREQVIQALLIADVAGELLHHLGVGDVLALRHRGHQQVLAHQPFHQLGFAVAEPVLDAELARIDRSEFRVIAAAALADVVEQAGEIQQFDLRQPPRDPAGDREALVVLGL